MTISSTLRKSGPLVGNGVATSFPFSFKVFATSDIVVTKTTVATGAMSVLVLTTDYTVSLNADQNTNPGGTVTYNPSGTPMTSAYNLTITSEVPQTQGTDIPNAGGWYPEVVENALDKNTILVQQLAEQLSRTAKGPVSDSAAMGDLPSAANRAGKFFTFDAAGAPAVSAGTGSDAALRTDLAASGGAALVGFIQAGAGAGLRTMQAKERDIVSVLDFHANGVSGAMVDPTGVTESTLGIQAADVAGTDVYFPPGIYKCATSASLTIGSATAGDKKWRGAGQNKSVLTAAGANSIVKNDFACTNIVIEDLGFNGNGVAPTCITLGDAVSGVGGITLDRVWASSATTINIELKHVSYTTIRDTYARYCEYAGAGQGISIGNGSTFINLEGCQFLALGQALVILGGSSAIRLKGCDFYSSATANASASFLVIQDSNHVWLDRCSFENLMVFTDALVKIKAPSGGGLYTSDVTFTDCYCNGLPYANDLFYLENGVYNIKFQGVRAITPNGGKYILNNLAAGSLVSADKCIALANYTDTAQTPWSVSNCSNAAGCAIAFNGGFAGQSIASFGSCGIINWQVNTGGVGNAADATDDTLFTYTLPAKAMLLDGQRVKVRAAVSTAANGNNKTFKIFFGNNVVISSGVVTHNAQNGYIEAEITRLSSTAICAVGSYVSNGTAAVVSVTTTAVAADLLANTTDIRVTGASPTTAAANDCKAYSMRVNFEN